MAAVVSDPPLAGLRADLARLGRRRATVRLGSAAATAGIILLVGAVTAFAVDYLADLRPVQRAVAFAGIAVACGWAMRRLVRPWVGVRETETDLALLVERQQGLEGDLVAALQFQSPDAAAWGSRQLEGAVVGYVDEASRELSVFEGFHWRPLPTRLSVFGAALLVVAVAAVLFSGHAAAFLRRLALADLTYPTRTVVESIEINGKRIDLGGRTPLSAPAGAPLTFAVTASGERPEGGEVELASDGGGGRTLALKAGPSSAYAGTFEAFTEPVTFTVRLGDARTPPRRIEIVPLPAAAVDLKPTPPTYARANAPAPPPAGVRTAFVLEGSDVAVIVRGTNKPLEKVTLSVGKQTFPLGRSRDGKTWTLSPAGTPLAGLREAVDFSVTATDAEGLTTAEPLKGSIRIRADRPPRVAAGAVVRRVVPTGRPAVTYGASDDYGVKSVRAKVTVNRANGKAGETSIPLPTNGVGASEVEGRYAIDLGSLGLAKGDAVIVTVEAEDARGDRPGETAAAEPITFEVTDREGLIASLLETDEEGAERLDEIIRRELGIGGER